MATRLAFGAKEKRPCSYREEEATIWLDTSRGSRIPAIHITRGCSLTLLVSHSNFEDLGIVRDYWNDKSEELEVDVFAYEYSGYGQATGQPSEQVLCADATAALTYMTESLGLVASRDIVLYGKSIGSVPTLHLAGLHAVRGIILVSGVASGSRAVSPTFGRVADSLAFNNLARLKKNRSVTPVQLIHGTLDEVVQVKDARVMHATCKAQHPLEPCWIDGGGHNGIETEFADQYTKAVRLFLQHLEEQGVCVDVEVPPGAAPGQQLQLQTPVGPVTVSVPEGVAPKQKFRVQVRPPAAGAGAGTPPPAKATVSPAEAENGAGEENGTTVNGVSKEDGVSKVGGPEAADCLSVDGSDVENGSQEENGAAEEQGAKENGTKEETGASPAREGPHGACTTS